MIIKPFQESRYVRSLKALSRRLETSHPKFMEVQARIKMFEAGDYAEKQVMFYLGQLPERQFDIFHNLRLSLSKEQFFQMDVVVTADGQIAIIEVKGYQGAVVFEHGTGRVYRQGEYGEEEMANPLTQVARHRHLLYEKIARSGFANVTIHTFVTFPFKTIVKRLGGMNTSIVGDEDIAQKLVSLVKGSSAGANSRRNLNEYLLSQHLNRKGNLLDEFNLSVSELRKGIFCDQCAGEVIGDKNHGTCQRCGKESRDFVELNIGDYGLLVEETTCASALASFLAIKHRKTMWRYLRAYKKSGSRRRKRYTIEE